MAFLHCCLMLSAFAATGYALSCTQCVSLTSDSCTGESVTCPSGNECGAIYAETTIVGITTQGYIMSCVPKERCNTAGSATLATGMRIKQGMSCCNSDNCRPSFPSFSPDDSKPNGKTCRSCMSADSNWCYTSDTIQCSGDENMCFHQSSTIKGPHTLATATRGCATKSFCNSGSETLTFHGTTIDKKITCTSGSAGLHKGFYLSAVLCVFLLKILF